MQPWIKQIFTHIIELEGGINSLTNIKNDRGGLTRAGLTAVTVQAFFKTYEFPNAEKMANLSEDKIYEIYYSIFWYAPQYDKLFKQRQRTATLYLVDATVQHGQGTAIQILQNTCNEISRGYNEHGYQTKRLYLNVDGIIGPITIRVASNCIRFPKFGEIFARYRQQYYNRLVVLEVENFIEKYPEYEMHLTQHGFLEGWTNRLIKLTTL